ncbi:hypothetical protein WA026_019444 [Henosepilachna vigintioctopunctata]|uniref:Uncharacterized protein n=1 Tax=Henosepilachna vigintioctopunctata TaxID=420089 RepID=A0AAW1UAW7_9CUCU
MLPKEFQNVEMHKNLLTFPSIARAVKVLKNRGDHRSVMATLPEVMKDLYFNEERNFVFQDYLLAEVIQTSTDQKNMESDDSDIFAFCVG